ncbi:MAG TPA: hypothetical protein VFR95_11685 [Gemmatimonadaceae bacterium]|nr:hypothetical protein [Gemmatimonadaceae bacterium]
MSAFRMLAMIPLAALAVACGRSEQPKGQAVDQALMSDLESASAPTAALASSNFKPTQVVSAIELGEPARANAPDRSAAPTHHAAPRAAPAAPKVKAVEPEPTTNPTPRPVVVAATQPAAEPAAEPAPVATPTAGPRPTPNPVDIPAPPPVPVGREPSSGGRGGGGMGPGGVIGAIGGVIIRGGSIGDDDHCEIHPGGGRGGVMINVPSPVIRRTFPRGAW